MSNLERLRDYAREHGVRYTLRRSTDKVLQVVLGTYDRRWRRERPDPAEKARQRAHQPAAGLLSVAVPVYNTTPAFLRELLESLREQTYENWEAILYDGGSDRAETLAVLSACERAGDPLYDARFRVVRAKKNLGISGNTNAAIALAKGDYIALCDHDDVLREDALWRMAEAIARESPDWLYSDEDMLTNNGRRHIDPHYKPDFCPEYLSGDNYISHLSVLRRSLLEKVGGLRPGFDGSQDHDLYLRCAAAQPRVVHVPYTLYSWRKARNSLSRQHLDQCLNAAARAAEDEARARGEALVAIPVDRRLRLWYDFPREARVEVILFSRRREDARAALKELEATAPWPGLSAQLVEAELSGLYGALNAAAAKSTADYLLFLDAAAAVTTRHFFRELLMYARRDGVAGVTPALVDGKGRLTHGGFALGMAGIAQGINTGLPPTAGGWHDLMNKVHNVSAVSVCCMMVRRDQFVPFDPRYQTGLGAAEEGLRATALGMRFVYTPHATVYCEDGALLLTGRDRYAPDVARFEADHGTAVQDPCYPPRMSRKKADYSLPPL